MLDILTVPDVCFCGRPVAVSGQCQRCYQRLHGELKQQTGCVSACKSCGMAYFRTSKTQACHVCRCDSKAKRYSKKRIAERTVRRSSCLCRGCGVVFDANASSTGAGQGVSRKFCSIKCRDRFNRQLWKKKKSCDWCGCEFMSTRGKFCSVDCVAAKNRSISGKREIPCAKCGTMFRERSDRHGYNKYCSRDCYFGSDIRRSAPPEQRTTRKLTKTKRMKIVERDRWKCRDCGCRVRDDVDDRHPRKANVDHVIPVSRGGTNEEHNLQCLCRACNAKKRDRKLVLF